MLPLDLLAQTKARISPKYIRDSVPSDILGSSELLEKKKKQIFTPELSKLIGKVSKKEPQPITEEKPPAEIPNFAYHTLLKIYSGKDREESVLHYIDSILKKYSINTYSVHLYENSSATFIPCLYKNLHQDTTKNLLFHKNDPYMENELQGYTIINFDSSLVSDTFFRKKFHESELVNYSGLIIRSLKDFNIEGLLVLFYENSFGEYLDDPVKFFQNFDILFQPIVPYLNERFTQEKITRMDFRDHFNHILDYIHVKLKSSTKSLYISKLTATENSSTDKKKIEIFYRKITQISGENTILKIAEDRFVILTEDEPSQLMNSLTSEFADLKLNIRTLHYPTHGKNIYLYI